MGAAAAALVGGAFVALGYDAWYSDLLISRERKRVVSVATTYASALESAVGRRVSRLSGLRTFVETRKTRAQLDDEFRPFADGLRVAANGIRALEMVRNGRVQVVVPLAGNETVLDYDLYSDTRPVISADVRRAVESGLITVTGPVTLIQGGVGLIVRERIDTKVPDFPDLVAMVLDMPPLLAEARSMTPMPGVRFALRDRGGKPLAGTDTSLVDPELVTVRVPDGAWTLEAVPTGGWPVAVRGDLHPTRIASAVIVLLLAWMTYVLFDRQSRLSVMVDERTAALRDANDVLTREVREREAVEQQLREKDERLRLALQAGRMGAWEYDPQQDRIAWSGSALEIMGHDVASASHSGAAFLASLSQETRIVVRTAVEQALEGKEARAEYRTVSTDGSERWLYGTGELQRDARGHALRVVGILADITDRRKLEEQLLHSQKMEAVGTLAGGIAHDFNNLLTAILGFAQLAQQQAQTLADDPSAETLVRDIGELRTDLDELMKAGERASLLTAQLLTFSRRQVVNLRDVDANAVLQDVERMLRRLIGERITLSTGLADEALPVRVDQGQIAQVIVNLVVNARDALPAGGNIRVQSQRVSLSQPADAPLAGLPVGEWVMLTVSDDGVGMSPDVVSRAFEPFFTTKPVGEGTGLGLSTVYGIIAQGGGRVFIESVPGSGTTVRVVLPRYESSERPLRATPQSAAVLASGERILVVEDEAGLRRLVALILTRRGYVVTAASDGAAALDVLASATTGYDLVLTDMVMPGVDGIALAKEIRARGLRMPILFMSGYPSTDTLPEDDACTFIAKPFTPESLAQKVFDTLKKHGEHPYLARSPLPS